jgi:hypothetical protein
MPFGRSSGLKLTPRANIGLPDRTMRLILVTLVVVLAGCGAVPISPTYSQQELKQQCEGQGGWWHEGFLTDGFCEYPGEGRA